MPIFDITCPAGHADEFIGSSRQLGEATCATCAAPVSRVWTTPTSSVRPDDVPGGFWIENMTPQPLFFRTRSEHRAKMRALGLQPHVKHVPGDKHVPAWGGIDPQTMANAAALVART